MVSVRNDGGERMRRKLEKNKAGGTNSGGSYIWKLEKNKEQGTKNGNTYIWKCTYAKGKWKKRWKE